MFGFANNRIIIEVGMEYKGIAQMTQTASNE